MIYTSDSILVSCKQVYKQTVGELEVRMVMMKAVRIHQYGGRDMLMYEDAPRPQPEKDEVLIRVTATSVNPFDCAVRNGYVSNFYQYAFPHILGLDVSGVVEAVGDEVSHFSVGDEVFARALPAKAGAYAEFIALPASLVAHKPTSLSMLEAAAVPHVTVSAWKAIVETANLGSGQSILIHAAAGGVGSIAVQLAKKTGAYVVGTATHGNHDFVRSLGADEVIDYTTTAFEDTVKDMDAVLDLVGNFPDKTYDRSRKVLKPGGLLISLLEFPSVQADTDQGVRSAFVAGDPCDGDFLAKMGELYNRKELTPIVSHVMSLEDIRKAHEMSESRHVRGKLVLQVDYR